MLPSLDIEDIDPEPMLPLMPLLMFPAIPLPMPGDVAFISPEGIGRVMSPDCIDDWAGLAGMDGMLPLAEAVPFTWPTIEGQTCIRCSGVIA